jgi:hypothetical protein
MGYGTYSVDDRQTRATSSGYYTKSRDEIFSRRDISNAMNPKGITVRESLDSDEHPNTTSVILSLDVTGSMGSVPHHIVKDGLPNIMGGLIEHGVSDPQLLFLAIGDHECDSHPLQVGQFESSDELLDKWLTDVYLEGGGGGNGGESYLLAWYFAAFYTSIDCFNKRNKKGFLFTIGDEPVLKTVPKDTLKDIMGDGEYSNYSAYDLLQKAREKYHVYHLHIKETSTGSRVETINGWRELIGDNLIVINRHEEVSGVISKTILNHSEKTIIKPNVKIKQEEEIL